MKTEALSENHNNKLIEEIIKGKKVHAHERPEGTANRKKNAERKRESPSKVKGDKKGSRENPAVKNGKQHRKGATRKRGNYKTKSNDQGTIISEIPDFKEAKKLYLDQKRNEEYKIVYDDSEDDEPSWDTRVTAVKKRQADLRLTKRLEAHKLEVEKAITKRKNHDYDTDSDYDRSDKDLLSPRARAVTPRHETKTDEKRDAPGNNLETTGDQSNPDIPDAATDLSKQESNDDTDEDGWFWDWGDKEKKNKMSAGKGGTTKLNLKFLSRDAKATRDKDNADDAGCWDSTGYNPTQRGKYQKKGPESYDNGKCQRNVLEEGTKRKKELPNRSVHAELRHRVECDQLENFKRRYYHRLDHPEQNSGSSGRNSISSSTSTSTSSSSRRSSEKSPADVERITLREERRKKKAKVYSFLDDSSSDESKLTTRTSGAASRLHSDSSDSRASISSIDNASRNDDREHRWNAPDGSKESSMTSKSTSVTDTEESSGSQRS